MRQAEFERHVGAENICVSVTEALQRATEVHLAAESSADTPVGAASLNS
jgi:hypothetical protein